MRGVTMVSFTASLRNNFVGGTCALPSALLVVNATHKVKAKAWTFTTTAIDRSQGQGHKNLASRPRSGWRGGLVVGRGTCDLGVAGSRPGRDAAAQQP